VRGINFLILVSLFCGCSNRTVDNPGDPCELILCDSMHQELGPTLPACVSGHVNEDGTKIWVKRIMHTPLTVSQCEEDEAQMDLIFRHEFCHLVDICRGDVQAARARLPHLSLAWRYDLEQLIGDRENGEPLWVTLQREYPALDAIIHPEIKAALGLHRGWWTVSYDRVKAANYQAPALSR